MIIHRKTYNVTYEVVNIPPYNAEIIICSTPDIENSKSHFKYRLAPEYKYSKNEAVTARLNFGSYILNFNQRVPLKTIAHEAVHIADYIYIDYGCEFSRHNDEPFAYLVEFIVDKISNFIKKINR
jgi:hypothetical protein